MDVEACLTRRLLQGDRYLMGVPEVFEVSNENNLSFEEFRFPRLVGFKSHGVRYGIIDHLRLCSGRHWHSGEVCDGFCKGRKSVVTEHQKRCPFPDDAGGERYDSLSCARQLLYEKRGLLGVFSA